MNTKILITAAIALLGTAGAYAGEATPDYPTVIVSSVNRDEVVAATQQARAAGLILAGEQSAVVKVGGLGLSRE